MDDGLRSDMVEAAKKFMTTAKVRDSPFEEQKTFLLSKGVTEAEIAEARRLIVEEGGGMERGGGQGPHTVYPYYPPPPPQNRFVSTAQAALVIGSVAYAGYKILRSFVLPKFFDIPDPAEEEARRLQDQVNELQNSIKFVMDSVAQTSRVMAEQQTELERLESSLEVTSALTNLHSRDSDLSRIESGISTIRSLLLNQNQFAPVKSSIGSIPAWQTVKPTETEKERSVENRSLYDSLSNGYTTPPANFLEDGAEKENDETKTNSESMVDMVN